MTIQRKQKQALRAFMAEHGVSYQEALRLTDSREIEATLTGADGTTYWLWIRQDSLELTWRVSETESATCVGSLWRWMTGSYPGDPSFENSRPLYSADGRVQSVAGSESLHAEMPWLPASVAAQVREYILRAVPNWSSYSSSTLEAQERILTGKDGGSSAYILELLPRELPEPVLISEADFER